MFDVKVKNTELQRNFNIVQNTDRRKSDNVHSFKIFFFAFSFKKRLLQLCNVYLVNSELQTNSLTAFRTLK